MDIKKSSGLILHPSSLPGEYGIGDLGLNSYKFVDLLKSSNTNIWLVLPLGITDEVEKLNIKKFTHINNHYFNQFQRELI